ncbi:hypothetical protein F5Y01DRAFT_329832 [Xylaria sp. FL0043]|nr:hypothetical protein F5Y01DRAFT_329832 [Xylaria sp. FL0043]
MFTPLAVKEESSFFYPVGHRPAVSLTQSMPPGVPTDLLLLGCGDVRNILFTCHIDGPRRMDITCCDNQKAIIARNILLLTLIIDQEDSQNDSLLWDIYYHMYLNDQALTLLCSQAKKLHKLSASLGTWQRSKYGCRLSYCDSTTLLKVRSMWEFYSRGNEGTDLKPLLESALERAKSKRSTSDHLAGLRSAIPAQRKSAGCLKTLHRHYWRYGSFGFNAQDEAEAKNPNPTFLVQDDDVSVHCCTNPLFGFHLATAFAYIRSDDQEFGHLNGMHQLVRVVEAARTEFRQWTVAYKKKLLDTRIRFFVGDAIAFAHTLQHRRHTTMITAHWYRDRSSLERLLLDGLDYASNSAPLDFDVIDTSNLSDHLGMLFLLTATAPLLRYQSFSVLFTEFHLNRIEKYKDELDSMLGGHVPTVSTLLGLFPVEYWTGISSVSLSDEEALNEIMAKNSEENVSQKGQIFLRTCQGPCPKSTKLQFNSRNLAQVLYQIYKNTFPDQHEQSNQAFCHFSQRPCHHVSFASFLHLVQTRVETNWDMGLKDNAPEELYTYFHVMGILSANAVKEWSSSSNDSKLHHDCMIWKEWGDIRDSKYKPPVVCMILEIPPWTLVGLAERTGMEPGLPVIRWLIQCIRRNSHKHTFSACQLTFGHITTIGKRHSQSLGVTVIEDYAGWRGSSPLIVAFYIAANLSTTGIAEMLLSLPGMDIPGSVPRDTAAVVYITRYAPNQTGFPVATGFLPKRPAATTSSGVDIRLTPHIDSKIGKIGGFTGWLGITYSDRVQAMRNHCDVDVLTQSPCELSIRIGQTTPLILSLPVYTQGHHLRVIDYDAFTIRLTVQVADRSVYTKWYKYMYPIHLREGNPINWNLSYVNLDKFPAIDISQPKNLLWLLPHLESSTKARERDNKEHLTATLPKPSNEELGRSNFKTAIFSFVSSYILHPAPEKVVFSIHGSRDEGDNHIFIIPTKFRINLADRIVLLECAISTAAADVEKFIMRSGYLHIEKVVLGDGRLWLWRQILPAYVERCRTWAHGNDCDYKKFGKIPLDAGTSERFLCQCGNGKFEPDFNADFPGWPLLKKHFVRAAISPGQLLPFR